MPTTGGALAFAGFVPPYEATLTKNLRDAGAIIIAKTGDDRAGQLGGRRAQPMPGNYNAVGGFGFNPYDPRPIRAKRRSTAAPRCRPADRARASAPPPTSGPATSAPKPAARSSARQTPTCSSASRPTIGRISRYGVIPITADQDTAGADDAHRHRCRNHARRARGRGARSERCGDKARARRRRSRLHEVPQRGGLKGARIGIPRAFYYDASRSPARSEPRGGLNADAGEGDGRAIAILKQQGAVIVDPADIPSFVDDRSGGELSALGLLLRRRQAKGKDADCSVVFKYGMKRDFNAGWRPRAGGAGQDADRAAGVEPPHTKAGAIRYGQSRLDISDEMDLDAIARATTPTVRRTGG